MSPASRVRPNLQALRLILAVKQMETGPQAPWETARMLRDVRGRFWDCYHLVAPRTRVSRMAVLAALLGVKRPTALAATVIVWFPFLGCFAIGLVAMPFGTRLLAAGTPLKFILGIAVTGLNILGLHALMRFFTGAFTEYAGKALWK